MSAPAPDTPGPRSRRGWAWATVVGAMLALLAGCGDDDADGDAVLVDPATATIVYRFNDASVPPEYHRSYTLTADADSANLVVDSYGDVLHDVTEPNVDDVWRGALDMSLALSNTTAVTSDGCVGGTSEELRVLDDENQAVVDVFVDHCGSSAGLDLDDAVAGELALFDLDELLATG